MGTRYKSGVLSISIIFLINEGGWLHGLPCLQVTLSPVERTSSGTPGGEDLDLPDAKLGQFILIRTRSLAAGVEPWAGDQVNSLATLFTEVMARAVRRDTNP